MDIRSHTHSSANPCRYRERLILHAALPEASGVHLLEAMPPPGQWYPCVCIRGSSLCGSLTIVILHYTQSGSRSLTPLSSDAQVVVNPSLGMRCFL